jgi:hypothetical protein
MPRVQLGRFGKAALYLLGFYLIALLVLLALRFAGVLG